MKAVGVQKLCASILLGFFFAAAQSLVVILIHDTQATGNGAGINPISCECREDVSLSIYEPFNMGQAQGCFYEYL
ncbi:MAG: hypothetical protein H8D93_00285 [Verrucomicrobia bacterium]|nr:hypothetical protein [Verrucomicrobiota bacterium]